MSIWTYITRHRAVFLFVGTLLAALGSLASDPDSGWATALGGLAMLQGIWAVAASHMIRKKLLDYPAADMSKLFETAGKESTGAGLALIAIAIVLVGLLLVFSPRAHAADQLPAGAVKYMPLLKSEQQRLWPDHPRPVLLASLVEQESCISLRSRGCWNPGAKLKTEREEGAGVGQITRAYRADGSTRFDALADLRGQYGAELGALTWSTVYQRPDLQFRALVLMSRDSARQFRQAPAALEFGDAGYNGGPGGVQRERRACALAKACDPAHWFGHVEHHCLKSRQPLYGGRSACDINREHVHNVFKVRVQKYLAAWSVS
ncbi:lytic murein transglycosylase [Pseudoduganella sp. FT55W]|uniref:Lytic murein transglycosylase n=1 Tax=Duganella rivi TaxID=2666083 RepID=A0A7X4K9Q1_9BURK|nr:lytic murein transglycosylase [Duganella rivi]MYM65424.1 lytic murein transglycosylase [Duganella rivi]